MAEHTDNRLDDEWSLAAVQRGGVVLSEKFARCGLRLVEVREVTA